MKQLVRFLSVVLALVLILGAFGANTAYSAADPGGKTRVLVQFAPGKRGNAENALNGIGAEFHYAFDELNTFAVTIPAAAVAGLSHNPNVVLIEEDAPRYPISITKSAAPAPSLAAGTQEVPYGVDMVQARDVWDVNTGVVDASNRKICIIDSGIYTGHEDLQGVNVSGYAGNLAWGVDDSGHGTHVSGTIAAMNNELGVVGVTPGTVNIYMVRVFGDDGAWAYSSTLINAANQCAAAGANIISMSLGGAKASQTEKTGFASLYSKGILSIAAAGNDGNTAFSYPASYDSVVSVAAIDSNKAVADFSQKNSQVELSAPGVGVLSTVPYIDASSLTVGSSTYTGGHVEFSARGDASGVLVNGGLCDAIGAWTGKVVLCQRGTIDFYTKVMNVQSGGGAAAVIYNNVSGGFSGTLGEGNSSSIVAISLSMEDGQALVANSLTQNGTVSSILTQPTSGYEYYDGTSMATPHVSAVAALVWSAKPTATNAEIRAVLQQTAIDLGAAGRDTSYGYGLVQAKTAINALLGSSTPKSMSVFSLTGASKLGKASWTATVTITVKDSKNALVSGAKVDGKFNTTAVSCTTNTSGQCSVSTTLKSNMTSVTYTVSTLTATGYTYNAAGNTSNAITIAK